MSDDREEYEVYDRHWNMVPDPEARFRRERAQLERMAEECGRFFAQPAR